MNLNYLVDFAFVMLLYITHKIVSIKLEYWSIKPFTNSLVSAYKNLCFSSSDMDDLCDPEFYLTYGMERPSHSSTTNSIKNCSQSSAVNSVKNHSFDQQKNDFPKALCIDSKPIDFSAAKTSKTVDSSRKPLKEISQR